MLPVDLLNEYVSNCSTLTIVSMTEGLSRDITGYRQRPTTNRGSLASNSATVRF